MVAHLPAILEWGFTPTSSRTITVHMVRCVRLMGMQSNVERLLVPDPMAIHMVFYTYITPKELVPIVAAVAIWGLDWAGQRVCCMCDNMAVVFTINKGSARDPHLMRLLRTLFSFCAHYECSISARHIAGVRNTSADALSRNLLPLFSSLNPQASVQPTAIGADLRELLLNQSLRWTSPTWTVLFSSTLRTVSHPQPEPAMPPLSADSLRSAKRGASGSHTQQTKSYSAGLWPSWASRT